MNSCADLYFASLLATARRIVELDSFVRNREWTNSIGEEQFGIDVHHLNIGIIGLGRIGRAIAKGGDSWGWLRCFPERTARGK